MKDKRELVMSFYEDADNLFACLHPDVEWHESEGFPYGGIYRGLRELRDRALDHLEEEWDDFRATPHTILPSGDDQVITLGHYSGVFKKTGKPMKAAFAHVFTFDEGQVVRFQQYGDSALFRAAMK